MNPKPYMKIWRNLLPILFISFNTIGHCQTNGNEDFEKFFEEFSFNEDFQKSRIIFPLLTIKYNEDYTNLDTLYIKMDDWKYNSFYFRTEWQARGQIYDSFEHQLRDTDERVFELIGIGNGVKDYYYFKRINGKWFLIKNIDYSS